MAENTFTRRSLCCGVAAAAAATTVAASSQAQAGACTAFDAMRQQAMSPGEAIDELRRGNQRFLNSESIHCDLLQQVHMTSAGQAPFAAVVGCMDSRVPPELIFDQQIGSIFSIRIAGNYVDTSITGGLEFANAVVGIRAILVLGHTGCGAIRGAIDDVKLGNLTETLAHLTPAVEAAGMVGADGAASNVMWAVATENVRLGMASLTDNSPLLAEQVAKGELLIAGAMHDISNGQVTFL
ncbi:MAG: carbonic anhydrase [Alphaproteobacteria bacterium]|jgi:carbonic anhydrase|nr:carbonic anhydrase [Rhodospirillaceae bacterium]MDG2479936.1 carbonic anhydrase [Alphaproteobacteria bacterium]MBT6205148.1 carbonic anhydrase [Rhodospirillaceae bacterium]MBT6512999.1 carbonic anhydrase [Rhodospirillaceae bacterium]MBT7611970.1 carbonic anhydrase [Rhodospirillaceae bacterium]